MKRAAGSKKTTRSAINQAGAFENLPPAPSFLTPGAVVIYKEGGNILVDNRQLNSGNYALLLAYAQELDMYFTISAQITKDGVLYTDKNDQVRQHPLTRISRGAFQNALAAAQKLHLTPEIQARLPVNTKNKQAKTAAMKRIKIAK